MRLEFWHLSCFGHLSSEAGNLPGFFIRIIPTAASLFSIPKLIARRNNVRALNQGSKQFWFFTISEQLTCRVLLLPGTYLCQTTWLSNYLSEGVSLPTPVYNSSILEDMFIEEFGALVEESFHDWEELTKALVLMKVLKLYVHLPLALTAYQV